MIKRWIFLAAIIALAISCEEHKDSPILMFLTPSDQYSVAHTGDLVKTEVEIQAGAGLKQLLITLQVDQDPSVIMLDSAINGNVFNFSFEFVAPVVADSASMLILFQATDLKDRRISVPRIMIIKNTGALIESTGHTLYSHAGNKQDAFNLSSKESLFSEYADSSLIDIIDVSDEINNNTGLSCIWKSYTGLKFVRFNDFDYANATYNYLKEVFDAGVKKDFISNIKTDDILLVRTSNNRYYAIRIVYVIDNLFVNDDRYIFNIKEPAF